MSWETMNQQPRRQVEALQEADLPEKTAGVYAFYLRGEPFYRGKAKDLRRRVWRDHLKRGRLNTPSVSGSALRRNVAEDMGIASADDLKHGRYRLTTEEALRLSEKVRHEVEVGWIETGTCHCGRGESCDSCEGAEVLEGTIPPPRLSKR